MTDDPKKEKETPPGTPTPPAPVTAVTKETAPVAAEDLREEDIQEVVIQAERQVNLVKQLKAAALKMTTPGDWTNESGRPYLTVYGAEKIAPFFGVNIQIVKDWKTEGTDESGPWFRFWYKGTATIRQRGRDIYSLPEVIGSCWTRDNIFKAAGGAVKSIAEIDESDVAKAAYSDLIRAAVSRLLGLRSCSWEELKAAGIEEGQVKSISRQIEATDDDKKKQEELRQIIKELTNNDGNKGREYLNALTTFQITEKDGSKKTISGVNDVTKLKEKRLEVTLQKAKEEKTRRDKANGGTPSGDTSGTAKK